MPKGQPDKGYAMTPQREKVLRILAQAGGSLDDEAGLVVSKLRERTGHETTQALSMVIKQLETSGLVKRDVSGRRTYHIELVTDALAPEDRALLGLTNGSAAARPTVLKETAEDFNDDTPVSAAGTTDGTDGTDYRRLADELLKSALNAIAHKTGDPKLKIKLIEAESRAAQERDRADTLEAQLLDRGAEILNLKEALRIAEKNLDTVQKANARSKAEHGSDSVAEKLTPRERRELADLKKLMESRPGV